MHMNACTHIHTCGFDEVSFVQGISFTQYMCWKCCIHMNDNELQLCSVVIVAPYTVRIIIRRKLVHLYQYNKNQV